MRKIFFILTVLTCSMNMLAKPASTSASSPASAPAPAPAPETRGTFCTIVCSPCDEVPNTVFKGQATAEQIERAQKEMATACKDK